ncbi:AEC family transporter [Solemya velesiana gill symbiont]|uniref:Transporter n=1 Tax=Solemya velesiana gill symbiont TaxID=1918948 RepID=A0A1T2KU04_9GAMM|nr:AEC family transporter [Solemya velesiana gill symbiont]OOZ36206.1 hypothetical protein BOW51_08355 [Solemya velesiana gill symbiont]
MLSIIYALVPVILVIILGLVLKRSPVIGEAHWRGIENLCYYILFPALLIKTLATAKTGTAEVLSFSGMALFAIFAMTGFMLALYPVLKGRGVSPESFTSLLQGATRWHGFIALSIVDFLLGDEAIAYMAITMAVIIPPLNIINVAVMASMIGGGNGLGDVINKIFRNPFIIACFVGALLNLTGIGLSGPVYQVFEMLGNGALGVGLLVVGAGLEFSKVLEHRFLVAFGTCIRLLGMPLLMFTGAWLFGIEGMPLTVAVIAGAVPTAASSYILARQMGADAPLMANLITVQVVVSIVTLPVMIWLTQGQWT